jgi:hypothetical protein
MSAHLDDRVKQKLFENKIDLISLLPHSSHLTQALDGTIFNKWKKEMKKPLQTNMNLSKRSLRIYKGVKSFESCTGFLNNLAAFRFVGITIDIKNGRSVHFDIEKILSREKAPSHVPSTVSVEESRPKPKRIKVKQFLNKITKIKKMKNRNPSILEKINTI